MIVAQRSEFASAIRQNGDRLSALIESLRARIAEAGGVPHEQAADTEVAASSS